MERIASERLVGRGTLPWVGWAVAFLVVGLTLMGLVALSSAGRGFSSDPEFILKRQVLWCGVALVVFLVAYRVNMEALRGLVWWIAVGAVVLLGLLLVPGLTKEINGARRWFDLGVMNLQPSDVAKPAMVLLLAHYLATQHRQLRFVGRGFLLPCAMVGVFGALVILQPDYGTAALFGAVGVTMLFLAGCRLFFLVPAVMLGLTGFAILVYEDPVRLARVVSFLDVEANRTDGSYQLWQGLLAFGMGGTQGVGLGSGQQQLSFLPEAHTDFIFPIIGEEMGLWATGGIVMAFALLFFLVCWHLRRAPGLFQFLLVAGSLLFVSLQAVINLGVVTALLPTKGMSLPFISYGGSNLVVMFGFVGLILNAFSRWEAPMVREPLEIAGEA